MLNAAIATALLLLPWFAAYLAIGIVLGPYLLRVVRRHYGVPIDTLRDTPVAIVGWIGVLARIVLVEISEA